MAKDPAFLFYSQDFYTGVATLNWEDRGKYISLICLMHQQGRMSEETIRFLVGSVSDNLKSKFMVDDNGLWYNDRLEQESEKRAKFTESRRLNGNLGGRPKESETNGKAKNNHKVKLKDMHKGNLMEDENDITIALANKKESFKKEIYASGELIYTKQLLEEFFEYWSEANRARNPKMRFEFQKTWELPRRLATWAKKVRDYPALLTESQKTVKQKQRDFSHSMEPFRDKFSSDTLNAFYRYWSMPENKPEPQYIRWELEEFWDLSQRLSSWKSSSLSKEEDKKIVYTIPK